MPFLKLPDPYPNAIRVGLAVFTATAIGYGIVLPEHGENTLTSDLTWGLQFAGLNRSSLLYAGIHTTYARQFSQASKWAAITCVVVNAPVIGKIAQVLPATLLYVLRLSSPSS